MLPSRVQASPHKMNEIPFYINKVSEKACLVSCLAHSRAQWANSMKEDSRALVLSTDCAWAAGGALEKIPCAGCCPPEVLMELVSGIAWVLGGLKARQMLLPHSQGLETHSGLEGHDESFFHVSLHIFARRSYHPWLSHGIGRSGAKQFEIKIPSWNSPIRC